MRSIRIRICHDHDFVIIDVFYIKVDSDASTNCMNNGVDFFVFENISKLCFFCIDDLRAAAAPPGIYGRAPVLLTRPQSHPLLDIVRFLLGF